MLGAGEVLKRRLKQGRGEFPIDCPVEDCHIRIHYRVRPFSSSTPTDWIYDSRADYNHGMEFDTGESAGATKSDQCDAN